MPLDSSLTRYCAKCQAALASDAPEGNCPRCLLALVFPDSPDAKVDDSAFESNAAADAGGISGFLANSSAEAAILDHTVEQDVEIDEVARGGMGVIHRVRDRRLDRVLAMTMMSDV